MFREGRGSVVAAQMAAEDLAKEGGAGAPRVEIVSADHQNKADVGASIARAWVDRDGVTAVVDVPNSTVALAVNQVLRENDRVFLASSSASSDLTGKACAPTTVQWVFGTWALSRTGRLGRWWRRATTPGSSLRRIMRSGELWRGMPRLWCSSRGGRVVEQTAQGLQLTEALYWDLNDTTRAWSQRFGGADADDEPCGRVFLGDGVSASGDGSEVGNWDGGGYADGGRTDR